MSEDHNEQGTLREALRLVWRNLPSGATTFGPCANNCGRDSGRGSGPCLSCGQDLLASVAGKTMAASYVQHIKEIRNLEEEFERIIR